MGVGTSKGTESSGLRAWSVSWPELYPVNEKRLIKDMTQYQDTTENNIWGVVRSCAPLTFSPLKHPTATPVAPPLIGISRESGDWSGGEARRPHNGTGFCFRLSVTWEKDLRSREQGPGSSSPWAAASPQASGSRPGPC